MSVRYYYRLFQLCILLFDIPLPYRSFKTIILSTIVKINPLISMKSFLFLKSKIDSMLKRKILKVADFRSKPVELLSTMTVNNKLYRVMPHFTVERFDSKIKTKSTRNFWTFEKIDCHKVGWMFVWCWCGVVWYRIENLPIDLINGIGKLMKSKKWNEIENKMWNWIDFK